MSRYSRLGPYMDANVYRSSPNAQYYVEPDLTRPRYATLSSSLSPRRDEIFRDPLDRHYSDSHADQIYRSGLQYDEHYSASSRDLVDLVRKTNQNASLSNGAIRSVTRDTLIQPKVCVDGRYPVDFSMPMRLSDFMALPETQLDRLLSEYGISTYDRLDLGGLDFDVESARQSQVHKLAILLEFLGADAIAHVLRTSSGGGSSRSRSLLARRST